MPSNIQSFFQSHGEKNSELFSRKRFHLLQLGVIFLICLWCCHIAYQLPMDQAPDEGMRYLIPKYIYSHHTLPTGYDKEAVYELGNWSYAFYPQLLGAILSAGFMRVMAIFSASEHALLFAARMTSVLFSAIALYFTSQSILKLTKNRAASLLGLIALGLMPQYTFLSSYVNNDIIAVAGASLVVYAMICAVNEGWNFKESLLLSAGFIICALGYLNSYSFILCGGLFFLIFNLIAIQKKKTTQALFWKNFALIFVLCAVCIFPFLIRNYLLYHDIFGMSAFREAYMQWLEDGGKVLQKPYHSLTKLMGDQGFKDATFQSFVGRFGYMTIPMGQPYYLFFKWIFGLGVFGFLLQTLKNRKTALLENADKAMKRLAFAMVLSACLITFGLQIYYTLFIDYQPQGRYIMSIAPALFIAVSIGFAYYIDWLIKPDKKLIVYLILIAAYIAVHYLAYKNFLLRS